MSGRTGTTSLRVVDARPPGIDGRENDPAPGVLGARRDPGTLRFAPYAWADGRGPDRRRAQPASGRAREGTEPLGPDARWGREPLRRGRPGLERPRRPDRSSVLPDAGPGIRPGQGQQTRNGV